MNTAQRMENRIGSWTGAYRLWLSPEDPPQISETAATVAPAAKGTYLTFEYTWAYDGEPQEGLLLIGCAEGGNAAEAVWIDSWHMRGASMACRGTLNDAGALDIRGSYAAPPGPDWGWRSVIEAGDGNSLTLIMYNLTPDGREERAVEAVYSRREG